MSDAELVLIIVSMAMSVGLIIGGMSVFLGHREKVLKLKAESQPDENVLAELDDLRNEVALLRDDLGDTMERIDVAERMLSSQRHDRLPPS